MVSSAAPARCAAGRAVLTSRGRRECREQGRRCQARAAVSLDACGGHCARGGHSTASRVGTGDSPPPTGDGRDHAGAARPRSRIRREVGPLEPAESRRTRVIAVRSAGGSGRDQPVLDSSKLIEDRERREAQRDTLDGAGLRGGTPRPMIDVVTVRSPMSKRASRRCMATSVNTSPVGRPPSHPVAVRRS